MLTPRRRAKQLDQDLFTHRQCVVHSSSIWCEPSREASESRWATYFPASEKSPVHRWPANRSAVAACIDPSDAISHNSSRLVGAHPVLVIAETTRPRSSTRITAIAGTDTVTPWRAPATVLAGIDEWWSPTAALHRPVLERSCSVSCDAACTGITKRADSGKTADSLWAGDCDAGTK